MKKFLNGLGVFGSIILTMILTVLIFLYVVILNVKFVVSEKGLSNSLKKVNIVETLKSTEDGVMWEDFLGLADSLNLTEEQFEQILSSDKVKEQVGSYIGEVISSSFNDKEATLTKERMEKFLNIAIDEYNKVSDIKINNADRDKIVSSFDEEMIANMNEEFSSINLTDTVAPEYVSYIEILDNILFGNYTLIMLIAIIVIIGLIALLRFSYYKWMPYVKTSMVISGILMLIIGLLLLVVPLHDMEILIPLKNVLITNIFITSLILFVLGIGLSVGKKYLKKYIDKMDKNVNKEVIEKKEEPEEVVVKVNKSNKVNFDKKTVIIIVLALVLILVILFLIFGRKGSYVITFDTDGGSKITSIEVKDDEIVKLPDAPVKEGYKFVGWTNEEGKLITKGTKVNEDLTLKAEWISNDAKVVTIKFDTDDDTIIDDIIVEQGKVILLPTDPIRDGYKFVGWLNENNNFITKEMIIKNNIKLKAMWIKQNAKISTIKFDTDGGSYVGSIIVENGKIILLPVNPTKEGYVFSNWVDQDGNKITKDTIVNKNMTIKALWKKPYTCPSGCTPIGDGSKCTKKVTTSITNKTSCPNGYTLKNGMCLDLNNQYHAEYVEISSGTYKWKCNSSNEYMYEKVEGMGVEVLCAKKASKITTKGCPSGYSQSGNVCKKTETIKCKAN